MVKKTKHKILKKACGGKGGTAKEWGKGFLSGVSNGASERPEIGEKILNVADKVKKAGSVVKNKMQEGYKKLRDATPEQIGKGVGTAVRGIGKVVSPVVLGAGAMIKPGIDSVKAAVAASEGPDAYARRKTMPAQPKGQTGTTTLKAIPAKPGMPGMPAMPSKPMPAKPMPVAPSRDELIDKLRERKLRSKPQKGFPKKV